MADISPNLLLPYILAAQAQKHVTHNEALRLLDAHHVLKVRQLEEDFERRQRPHERRSLRRHLDGSDEEEGFPRDVMELQAYLGDGGPEQAVRAIPGLGTHVPIWLLGSSLYSAQLAAYLGLPFAFASHFAPDLLLQALQVYRAGYRPSAAWPQPHAMVGINVVAADSDDAAARLFTSIQQRFLGMQRGRRGPLPRPIDPAALESMWTPQEKAGVQRMLAASAVGSAASVRRQVAAIVERTAADELIVAGAIHDHAARLRSYELLALG